MCWPRKLEVAFHIDPSRDDSPSAIRTPIPLVRCSTRYDNTLKKRRARPGGLVEYFGRCVGCTDRPE